MGPHELAWKEFFSVVSAKGLQLIPISVKENEEKLKSWEHPEKEKIRTIWKELIAKSFRESKRTDWKIIRKKIRKL